MRTPRLASTAAIAIGLVAAPCFATEHAAVFSDRFDGERLDAAWRVDVSPGNAVEIRDGNVNIRARLNTHAHIERALDRDRLTVSALMQTSTPAGVSWSSSVFLYWSPGVWCQLGIIDFQDGQYYVVEAAGGKPRETYLEQCDRTQPHWLRIELGSDCVRYLTRTAEQSEWQHQRTIRRSGAYAGAPELVILGKGYGQEDGDYGAPDNVFFSYPVTCSNGSYEVVNGLDFDDFGKEKFKLTGDELVEERTVVQHLLGQGVAA